MHPVPVLSRVRGAFQKKQIPCRPGGENNPVNRICPVETLYSSHEKQNHTVTKLHKKTASSTQEPKRFL